MNAPAALPDSPLKFLFPGWFAVVMGLSGLSLAWHAAQGAMGPVANTVSQALGLLAAAVFAVLAAAALLRWQRFPQAWAEDLRHPVRHTFVAALPVAVILLATVATVHQLPQALAVALWLLGSVAQWLVTLWVLARWWRGNGPQGLQWASLTPALFIPVVGNVVVALAGVRLGYAGWAAAQFGVGLLFWPLVMAMIFVRVAVQGPYPERLLPANFIFVAPPAVAGLGALQLGASPVVAQALWGMALFTLMWVGTQAKRIAALPFGLPHWGMSFPLAAMAAFTWRLAGPGSPMQPLAVALLALASVVIAWLCVATLRGLRDGTLLAPEPVAAIVPAAA